MKGEAGMPALPTAAALPPHAAASAPNGSTPAGLPPALESRVYHELRVLARRCLGIAREWGLLQATSLAHEAWLRLGGLDRAAWGSEDGFKALAAAVMRRILVDEARREGAAKRGKGWRRIPFDDAPPSEADAQARGADVLDLHATLGELESFDAFKARVVELRFFGGLTVPQAARVLAVSDRTIELEWRAARAWLRSRLERARP